MSIHNSEKLELIKKFGKSAHDTGSSEVQIAILTKEINALTSHLIKNKKDYISKRGLFTKVSRRKALLKYLETNDIERWRKITQAIKEIV